jgi:hypothetical protein
MMAPVARRWPSGGTAQRQRFPRLNLVIARLRRHAGRKCANRAGGAALEAWQSACAHAVDTAQSTDRQMCGASQSRPTQHAETHGAGVTGRGERGAEECEPRAGPACPAQFRNAVRRAGAQPAAGADTARPVPAAQMHAGVQFGRQAWFSRHDQGQPSRPAQTRQIASQSFAVWLAVMTQDDAAQAAWEGGDRRAWVGQPPSVGEQPQHWN